MRKPRIELVYFEGCPHVATARANLRDAIEVSGRSLAWTEWDIERDATPARLEGLASPTVLVDGRDVTGRELRAAGVACRTDGAPSVEAIALLLADAPERRTRMICGGIEMAHVGDGRARSAGRIVRLLVGLWLLFEAGRGLIDSRSEIVLVAAGVALGELAFYVVAQVLLTRSPRRVNGWLGATLSLVPVAAVFVLGGAAGQLGSLLFVGISLVAAAARADAGCEVMSIPAILTGHRTHLACLAFSPVDWVEERIAERRSAR